MEKLVIERAEGLPGRGNRGIVATIKDGERVVAQIEVRHSRTHEGFYRVIGKRVGVRRGPASPYDTYRFYSEGDTKYDIAEFLGNLVGDTIKAKLRYGEGY